MINSSCSLPLRACSLHKKVRLMLHSIFFHFIFLLKSLQYFTILCEIKHIFYVWCGFLCVRSQQSIEAVQNQFCSTEN